MILGPPGFNKIAILGTAPATMALAPFKDPSWSIWACSPGAYPICAQNRSDVWFEPHRWLPTPPGMFGAPGTKPWFSPEFHTFLKEHKGPVFMSEVQASIPNSVRIPFEALMKKYGHYYWTSTIAYMLALAIDELAPRAQAGEEVAIGMWGVDMSATEEYAYQRPACQHFIGFAASLGIGIVLPEETDLMRPPTMYGLGELNPRHIKLLARRAEMAANLANLQQQHDVIIKATMKGQGVLEQIDYDLALWSDDIVPDIREAVSFASEHGKSRSTGAEVVNLPEAHKA